MNNKKDILKIINEIKQTNKIPDNIKLTIDILLYKDENNKTLLEYMLENEIHFYYSFVPEIPKIKEAVYLMYKYGKISELYNIDTKIFLSELDNGKILLEELIENKQIDTIHNIIFEYDEKLIDILIKTNRFDLIKNIKITEYQLFEQIKQNKLLIEILIEKNVIDYIQISKIQYHTEIVDILKKYNKLYLIEKIVFNENKLLENNENCLLKKIIDLGYKPNLKNCKTKTLNYLYKINRPDLMTKIFLEKENIDLLFHYVSLNENVISYILKSKNQEIDISDITTHIYQLTDEELIDIYLKFAKYDKLDYLFSLTKEELLKRTKKNECMLDKLLKLDVENTKKILNYFGLTTDIDILMYLKFKNIKYEVKEINFELLDKDLYSYEFTLEQNKNLKNTINYNNIPNNIMELLIELQDLMNDGQSNNDMVEALLLSYANEISKGNQYAIIELTKLIEIKKSNPNFKIIRSENGAYFNEIDGIHLTSCDINTLNHELGHLFHYYLANDSVPTELITEINKIVSNEELKEKIKLFSINLNEYSEKMMKDIEEEYDIWFKEYYTDEKIEELKDFIEMSKEEKIEQYKKLGYKEEDLNIILEQTYTYEQYVESQKRIKCKEMYNNKMSMIMTEIRAISDIIDAVYAGKYYNSKLKTKEGQEIEGTFGHGIAYYNSIDSIFQEMIANYSLILKSDGKDEGISLLKELFGTSLVNILDNFYKEEIINSQAYTTIRVI